MRDHEKGYWELVSVVRNSHGGLDEGGGALIIDLLIK